MPFKSRAQEKWMWANKPDMAKRWDEHTPDSASLPEHVRRSAKKKRALRRMKRRGR